ncbi:MAG: glycoside hydrolase [Ardenticatenaceae bacterium]|nr:glycoside hydrolase [Ardenticatenaceae bacterium]
MAIDLSGSWKFELDREDQGVADAWWQRPLTQEIQLPGILQAQGFGDEVTVETEWIGDIFDPSFFTDERYAPYREPGNVKFPCWLTPDKYYMGAAWYQREVEIPGDWAGKRLTLFLERSHWQSRVWWDDVELGSDLSLGTPHVYVLGTAVSPGKHRLTVRVDNRMIINVGSNAHSMSDHTQGNWNGLAGRLEIQVGDPVWFESVQIYPNVRTKRLLVEVRLGNKTGEIVDAKIQLQAKSYNSAVTHEVAALEKDVTIPRGGMTLHLNYMLGEEAQLWDEFSPALYELDCQLTSDAGQDQVSETFGLREIKVEEKRLVLNGRRIFLRGTLECSIFPLTGHPPTEVEAWKRIIRVCQSYGLNHIRFHSHCPPEAAFVAADEMGFYYQVECSSWANQGSTIGEGRPLDSWLYEEGERIVAAYGNHPSFLMMAYGNEPSGDDAGYLGMWDNYWRGHDARRIHTSGAGWPIIPESDYHNIPQPRIHAWGAGLNSRINGQPPETVTDYTDWVEKLAQPIVSHEIGQWCVYPDFDEIEKYTGHLKAKNFEIFRDFLDANHMGDQARDFFMASGKLQTLCYKEEIESSLRTPGFGGFQLLDLHDFPGQGTALVGVVDPFWNSKPYVSPEEYRRFAGATVPLARLAKRYWRVSETLTAVLDIAHFGAADLVDAVVYWRLEDGTGTAVQSGELAPQTIVAGELNRCGEIAVNLAGCVPAQGYKLVVGIADQEAENDWAVWLFADEVETAVPDNLLITHELDQATLDHLAQGGKALYLVPPEQVKVESHIGFSSAFWNTSWTQGQLPHTLGIVCDPEHPLFAHFPTAYHSDWQWWDLIHGSQAMVLDGLVGELRPLVQPIDTWFEARRLGLLFEAQVNGGSLMICSMDLESNLDERLVARQMRFSLLQYLASAQFAPAVVLETGQIEEMIEAR